MAVLYWKTCYNEAHYNEVGLYMKKSSLQQHDIKLVYLIYMYNIVMWSST